MTRRTTLARWYALRDAAHALGLSPGALRKLLERRAKRSRDGATEATVDEKVREPMASFLRRGLAFLSATRRNATP
jgi:hypothetical protein